MQAIYRLLRKIVIVTHIFSDVPQLNITNFSQLSLKDLSVALLFITFFIVQFSRCRLRSKTGSKHLNTFKCFDPFSGGDNRIRTDDLLRAKQALSHLSYTPVAEEIGGP